MRGRGYFVPFTDMVTLEERWTSAKAVVVDFHADRIREYDSMRFRYWLTWTPSIVNIYILYKPICLFRKQSYVIKLDKLKSINLLKSPEHSRRLRTLHTKSRRRHRLMPWCVPGFVRLVVVQGSTTSRDTRLSHMSHPDSVTHTPK